MTTEEQEQTIRRILQGEVELYASLVREYSLPIRGYLSARLHQREEVEDLAQEVFLAAYRSLDKYRPGESFMAWLFGISQNKILQHLRSAHRRDSAMERFHQFVWDQVGQGVRDMTRETSGWQMERLSHCLERLPARLSRVVRALLREEKVENLCAEFGVSRGAIYTLHWRAVRQLRQCMGGEA